MCTSGGYIVCYMGGKAVKNKQTYVSGIIHCGQVIIQIIVLFLKFFVGLNILKIFCLDFLTYMPAYLNIHAENIFLCIFISKS